MNGQKLVDKFMSNVWLISNIFWKYSDDIVYNRRKEKAKLMLSEVYGYTDIYSIFPSEVDEAKTIWLVKILNQYYDQREPESEPKDR